MPATVQCWSRVVLHLLILEGENKVKAPNAKYLTPGKTFTLDVDTVNTIEHVKRKIEAIDGTLPYSKPSSIEIRNSKVYTSSIDELDV